MRLLRPTLVATALLLTLAFLPPPAAAGSCAGTWVTSASCFFSCDGPFMSVSGWAQNPSGAPASVTVTAQCGIVNFDGTFTPIHTVTCSAGGTTPVSCGNAGINVGFFFGLVGICTVSGNDDGTYGCSAV